MLQPEPGHGIRDPAGFAGIQFARLAGANITEATRTGADITHDHHGRVPLRPAFPDIRARGFLAHRDQAIGPHECACFLVNRAGGRPYPYPGRFALDRIIGPVRLFRVTENLNTTNPMINKDAR